MYSSGISVRSIRLGDEGLSFLHTGTGLHRVWRSSVLVSDDVSHEVTLELE